MIWFRFAATLFLFWSFLFPQTAISQEKRIFVEYENQHISAVAFSPDGKFLACGLKGSPYPDDKSPAQVELRDSQTGRLRYKWKAAFGELNAIAFLPDGHWIAAAVGTGGWRVRSEADPPYPKILGEAYIWDTKTGRLKHKLTLATGQILSIAFSPDSRFAAVGAGDTTIRLWDLSAGQSKWVVTGQARHVTSVAFSPDGKQIIAGSWDKSIRFWDAKTGQLKRVLTPQNSEGQIFAVAIAPRGRFMASAGNDRLRLWNLQTGKMVRALGKREPTNSLLFSPTGKWLASIGTGEGVKLWRIGANEASGVIETRSEAAVSFAPDGKILAVADSDSRTTPTFGSRVELYQLPQNILAKQKMQKAPRN